MTHIKPSCWQGQSKKPPLMPACYQWPYHTAVCAIAQARTADICCFHHYHYHSDVHKGTNQLLAVQGREKKQRVGATQRLCHGLGGLWQVAGAALGVGVECAPALETQAAPPSSEVSASTGKNCTPIPPFSPATSPPPARTASTSSSPLHHDFSQSSPLVHAELVWYHDQQHSSFFCLLKHLLASGITLPVA